MSHSVMLHPRAASFPRKVDTPTATRIKKRLEELRNLPTRKGQRLSGTPFWRIEAGDYRAIYEVQSRERRVVVLFIGHRRSVYDDFSRLL